MWLCLVLLPSVLAAQELAPTPEVPAVWVESASDTAENAVQYERVIEESIRVVLARSGYELSPSRTSADLVWEYAILSLVPRLHVSVSVQDAALGTLVASASGPARANVTLFNSIDDIVSRSVGMVQDYVAVSSVSANDISAVTLAGVMRLQAEEEQALVAQPLAPLDVQEDGVLVASDVQIPVSLRRRGYTGVDALLLPGEPMPPQDRIRRTGIQVHSSPTRLTGLGIGGRYDLARNRFAVAGEMDVFLSGVLEGAPYQVLSAEFRALAELNVMQLGIFSLRASSGPGFLITTFLSGLAAPYSSTYWNVFNLTPTIQTGRQFWFARIGLNYRFQTERGFFETGLDDDLPQLFVGSYRMF